MKALPFPVAILRKSDGVPAVWMTFTNWLVMRDGLIREYIGKSEYIGARLARLTAGRADIIDTWGRNFEEHSKEAAFQLYKVGYDAHRHIHEGGGVNYLSPEKLVALGDAAEQRGIAEETKRLATVDSSVIKTLTTSSHGN